MSEKETEFFKALKTVRDYLTEKRKDKSFEIASATNLLWKVNEGMI